MSQQKAGSAGTIDSGIYLANPELIESVSEGSFDRVRNIPGMVAEADTARAGGVPTAF